MGPLNAPTILWLRRDLRVFDHPGFEAVLQSPNPRIIYSNDAPASPFQRRFLHETLQELARNIRDFGLELEYKTPAEIIKEHPERVVVTADYSPKGLLRDKQIADALGPNIMQAVDCNYAVQPGFLKTSTGGHYKVFTPFYRAWSECGWEHPNLRNAKGKAWEHWQECLEDGLNGYATQRDRPDIKGTSQISHYLSLGALHPRSLLETLQQSDHIPNEDRTAFARELAFREFYADFVYHRPESLTKDVNPKFAQFKWNDISDDFQLWKTGHTGYPIIDAGMRQLNTTGWMHNRVRMLVASFLTKDLLLPWQLGAEYFRDTLIDYDETINQHSWQWCAGTGTDASPYFRIFNPQTQGKRYDPDAIYIRKWVPELAETPADNIHKLRDLPETYPKPIVDHAEARLEALARYQAL
ncbi:cryptochrome/photolyase family protein [Corynebacterium freiburgense]|uniref:cryptochrome/photolyase family protein n=1 Tax=Corynebacterium freiburgense TaxID=556548 RepID=UPI00041A3644|nr:deoxyribodipyrimidine photo-lyase [Corynebacterium freiburgense]WJZ01349.1 Deoxyribodipyrimidine photo-lyase [Corynebacterium freiburgense]